MNFSASWLSADHPAVLAFLARAGARIAAGQEMDGSEAAILYSVAKGLVEVGIGNRLMATNQDRHPGTEAAEVLLSSKLGQAGVAEIDRWVREYEARVTLFLGGHGALPVPWAREEIAGLIGSRHWLGAALSGVAFVFETTPKDRALVGRAKGLAAAVALTDERFAEAAVDLLPLVRRVTGTPPASEAPATAGSSAPSAWLDDTSVKWWSDLKAWSASGMTDRELASTWLLPLLRRTAALDDAMRESDDPDSAST